MSGDGWETHFDKFWGEVPRLLRCWRVSSLGVSSFSKSFFLLLFLWFVTNLSICCVCAVKKRPKLKSKYKECVKAATKYVKTIDEFDDLVDPRTLACHCLGLKPSSFVLRVIEIEEKSKCLFGSPRENPSFLFFFFNKKCFSFIEITTKFNQEMYVH